MNLLDNTQNQPTKFRAKNWVEINDDSRGRYNTNSQIKFKTLMLKSGLCDYIDANILVSRTIAIPSTRTVAVPSNRKNIIIESCAPFTNCISETNNTEIDNTKNINAVVTRMYNLIEYSDNYSKTGDLWQYYRDEPVLNANGAVFC